MRYTADMNTTLKRGSIVVLPFKEYVIYIERTEEEMQALRDADAKAGIFLDSAGEPRLYSPYGGWVDINSNDNEIRVNVVSLRTKHEWKHWRRKPRFLKEGTASINGVPRTVYFTERSNA